MILRKLIGPGYYGHGFNGPVNILPGIERTDAEADSSLRIGPKSLMNQGCTVKPCARGDSEVGIQDRSHVCRVDSLHIACYQADVV